MRFIGYAIKNFKAIEDELWVEPLERLNVIIGPNNEGKSSLLEPLVLLKFLYTPISDSVGDPGDFIHARLPKKSEGNPFELTLKFAYSKGDVDLGFSGEDSEVGTIIYKITWAIHLPGAGGNTVNIREIVIRPSEGADPILVVAPQAGTNIRVLQKGLREILSGDNSNNVVQPSGISGHLNVSTATSDVNVEYGLLKFLSWWASNIVYVPSQREVQNIGAVNANTKVIDQTSIPALILEMHINEELRFIEFETLITNLISSVSKIHTPLEPGNLTTSIRISNQAGMSANDAFRLDTVGAGVREIIYLAASVWLSPPGSVIIVEEPERGLHPGAQRVFLNSVLKHAADTGKQLFWTTHSTIMAPLFPDSSVFVAGFSPEKTTVINPILDDDSSPILDALGQRMVDFYNYDLLVLYDGQTEEKVIPLITEELLTSQIARGINFYSLNGDVNSKEELVNALIRALSTGHTKVFIMADDDEGVEGKIEDLIRTNSTLSSDHVHIWDCEVKGNEQRRAEFEDNFSKEELVLAANQVANDTKLKVEDFKRYLDENPTTAISKTLQHLYWDEYKNQLGKLELGSKLALIALEKIRGRNPNDENSENYEFEIAIDKLSKLL